MQEQTKQFLCRRWAEAPAPGIQSKTPIRIARVMRAALRSLDRDIQLQGAVSYETVEVCRAALALANT